MRTLFVVETLEVLEALELLAQAARRRFGGVLQQRQMQPLQPSVLLRLAGRDALGHDARLDHLDRQLRQSARPARRKRRPVVGAQADAAGRTRGRPHRAPARHDRCRCGQRLAAQQITAVRIAQRQRLAMRAVAGQEPALEVDAPHIVGGAAMGKRRARRRAAATQPALDRQALAVEQRSDRARCRPSDRGCTPLKPGPHLHRSPGRMFPPRLKAALGDLAATVCG